MNKSARALSQPSSSTDQALVEIMDRIADRLQAGEAVDVDALARQYPEHADRLRELLPAARVLAGMVTERPVVISLDVPELVSGTLADFRIVREVGRGGMGVVYEAEQISLGRRVALKVLPFAATMDPRQLLRFQNEARAAASLEHPHIAPVYAVGCERGVHYFAMKFIDGQTLAQIIASLKTESSVRSQESMASNPQRETRKPKPDASTACNVKSSTIPSAHGRAFYQTVARLGIEAAQALEHSHSVGVVHRDIKPANLMIDNDGKLWVTDFGLARMANDTGLTMTGDMLGTLRYMSPEQAGGGKGVLDQRTDIYSLGATLYELLTLRPPFDGVDRGQLLRQIEQEEPVRLQRIQKAIPAELETIVLKALEKDPADRYRTAQELANDLQCFLDDKPIAARSPGLARRVQRWARRHRAFVVAAFAVLLFATIGLAVSTALIADAYQDADAARVLADKNAAQARKNAEEAANNASQAERQRQRAVKYLQLAGAVTEEGKNWPDAIRLWKQVIVDFPGNASYRQSLYRCLHGLQEEQADSSRYAEAAATLTEAIKVLDRWQADLPLDNTAKAYQFALPNDYYWRAMVCRRAGLFADAGDAYSAVLLEDQKCRARNLRGYVGAEMVEHRRADAHNGRGEMQVLTGKFQQAEQSFTQALEVSKTIKPGVFTVMARVEVARAETGLGDLFQASGQPDKAVEFYRRALKQHEALTLDATGWRSPSLPALWRQLAQFLVHCQDRRLRDYERAVEAAAKALELAKPSTDESSRCARTLALAHYRAAQFEPALAALERAGSHAKTDSSIRFLRAMALWRLDKKKDATDRYREAAKKIGLGTIEDGSAAIYQAEAADLLGIQLNVQPKAQLLTRYELWPL